MSSSRNNAVQVPEENMAVAREVLAYGTTPRLWLSHGMLAMQGMHPALIDAVEVAPSFTVLSPPTGLDFFAVLDGRSLGTAAAAGKSKHLLALLRDAVARQVYLELSSDSPRFLDETSHNDVVWWLATTLRKAFQVFHDKVTASRSHGEPSVHAATGTAIVALVLEKCIVVGNCGTSKAVLSRDGEVMELSSDPQHLAQEIVVGVVAVEREACDEFLILGSAAFWEKVTPAAACAHVRRRLGKTSRITMPWETRITDPEGSPKLLAEELAKKAVHAGSRDNVSVGLVLFRDFWGAGHAHAG